MRPHLVLLGKDPADVAAHAAQSGLDDPVGALGVADDLAGGAVDAPALGVGDEIPLEAVGQVEDDLSARLTEAGGVGEDVLLTRVVAEIEAAPERAVGGVVALEDAVGAGDAAVVEPGAEGGPLLDMGGAIDAEEALERLVGVRQRQKVVVRRGPRRRGNEPVGPHAVPPPVFGCIGIRRDDLVPGPARQTVVPQIDSIDQPAGQQGRRREPSMPRQAVEQLRQRVPQGDALCGPIHQIRHREVSRELAVTRRDLDEIFVDEPIEVRVVEGLGVARRNLRTIDDPAAEGLALGLR